MGGIAGIIAPRGADIEGPLIAMVQALAHRGPDGHGQDISHFADAALGLGATRLAVAGQAAVTDQPTETRRLAIDSFRR